MTRGFHQEAVQTFEQNFYRELLVVLLSHMCDDWLLVHVICDANSVRKIKSIDFVGFWNKGEQ